MAQEQHLAVLCACPWVSQGPDGKILCSFTRAVADLVKQSDLVREETSLLRADVRSALGSRDTPSLVQLPDRVVPGCAHIDAKTGIANAR